MKRLLATISLCCILSPAGAADPWGKYADYGVPTCKNYLEALARVRKQRTGEPVDGQYQRSWGWIAGYLTSYNMNVPDTFDIIGDRPPNQQLAVEVYCKEHPDDDFAQLMRTRLKDLYFLRLREQRARGD